MIVFHPFYNEIIGSHDDLEYIGVDLIQSCAPDAPKRKQNYRTNAIKHLNPSLLHYKPTQSGKENTQQLIHITKASTGVMMKTLAIT